MFTPRDELESGQGGPQVAAATLSLADAVRANGAGPGTLGARLASWFDDDPLIHDLADDIGSLPWFRGLGTMLGLAVAAISFWPDFTAVEAATLRPADTAARDEYRTQMIAPLALGGDSGRRMGTTDRVRPLAAVAERPVVALTATLGDDDSFGRMLQRAGVGSADAARATELISAAVPLDELVPGTRVGITLGRRAAPGAARPLDRLDLPARFDLGLAVERRGGALVLARRPIAVTVAPMRITGTVADGLYRSARAAGAPAQAIQAYLQTIGQHVSIEGNVAPGDRFDMVFAYKRAGTREGQVGDLLYAGLERGGQSQVALLRWGKNGQFFEATGSAAARRTVTVTSVSPGGGLRGGPVNGRMTSGYGARRHPILGYVRMHAGIDFGAAWGAPIFATGDGVVSYAGRHGGHGNYVRIDHGGGLGSGYGHMSRIAVAPGTQVRAGQVIGYVGSTGLSTGPHLHYEVYRNGRTVDPLSAGFGGLAGGAETTTVAVAKVDQRELAAFKARLEQLQGVAPGIRD